MGAQTARAAQGQAAKADLLSRLQSKKPMSATYDVVLDPGPVEALGAAQNDLKFAELTADPDKADGAKRLDEAKKKVTHLEPAAREAVVTLHFQGLSRPAYEALLDAHPPTGEQKKLEQTYNDVTFAPALIAATIVDPDTGEHPLTPEDVRALFDDWNQAEVSAVWNTALRVCTQFRSVNVPFGSGTTRG